MSVLGVLILSVLAVLAVLGVLMMWMMWMGRTMDGMKYGRIRSFSGVCAGCVDAVLVLDVWTMLMLGVLNTWVGGWMEGRMEGGKDSGMEEGKRRVEGRKKRRKDGWIEG